jgi:hypothetical protein
MDYSLTQCRSNPWQVGEYAITDETDDLKFVRWLNDNGVQAISHELIPSPAGFATCDACNCGTGETYHVVVSPAQVAAATALGFQGSIEGNGEDTLSTTPTNYSQLTWLVINPYQCFANKWPIPKQAVKSTETDMRSMREWLEGKGATINELALIRGVSTLNVECLKRTNDIYAVGVENNSDAEIVRQAGFVYASAAQALKFSSTPADDPVVPFVYKTKYCTTPAWDVNLSSEADYASSAMALAAWLKEKKIPYEALTLHTMPKSSTGSCDTDSGYGMRVLVPKWATYHLGPYGFVNVSTVNVKNQVYPNKNPPAPSETIPEPETVAEYYASIDYSCNVDADCVVKNIGRFGYYPGCTNANSYTNPALISRLLTEEQIVTTGWAPTITSCICQQNSCVDNSS